MKKQEVQLVVAAESAVRAAAAAEWEERVLGCDNLMARGALLQAVPSASEQELVHSQAAPRNFESLGRAGACASVARRCCSLDGLGEEGEATGMVWFRCCTECPKRLCACRFVTRDQDPPGAQQQGS